MPTQRQYAAAGTADIAEQPLDDRSGPDHLDAGRMVRPADCIADRPSALAAGIACQSLCDFDEHVSRAARRRLDHFGRIGGVMAAQDLVDAMRMLQCRVARRRPLLRPLGFLGEALRGVYIMLGQ
jgi:hypothetical protein